MSSEALPDRAARERAVDPRFNVALEASAGTGKTRVLVDRYINLLREGVDPSNILAMTFTRKAAAEMRERIMATLRAAAARGEIRPARWRELRDRMADIGISTIDSFCLSLLREFPLEADLDPGFSVADESEVPRFVDESLDRTLRIARALALDDESVALVFAQLGERRLRAGLAGLLGRRLVASNVLARLSGYGSGDVATATSRVTSSLLRLFEDMPGGIERFLESGPPDPAFVLLNRGLVQLSAATPGAGSISAARLQPLLARVREHFLTQDGQPRSRLVYPKQAFVTEADWQVHRTLVTGHAERVAAVLRQHRADLNLVVARGVRRVFAVAEAEYRRTLDAHAVLDFPDLLHRALGLLRQMEEFSQSRYRLESRYHHVLVDEFQDTSRAQWELVSLLTQSWGEGMGLAHSGPLAPSIFIVGDRKQSIYGFRDADVSMLREASRFLDGLRPGTSARQAISHSFRSVPALLSFVNDVCADMEKVPARSDAFSYEDADRFPLEGSVTGEPVLGLIAGDTPEGAASAAAAEIAGMIAAGDLVRDRESGLHRPMRASDVAILFRTRDSHREFETALEARGVPSYVYKGLGFFDADEVRDVMALLWYLAEPASDLRAAALMRSRFIGLSDEGLQVLAPWLADALRQLTAGGLKPSATGEAVTAGGLQPSGRLSAADRLILAQAGEATRRWLRLVDRLPPAELLDLVLSETAYGLELRGPRFAQARENVKKVRAIVRRIQNRGYATIGRIAAHLDRLAVGDEANAVIDAANAVHLMTVHAAKGLEFPVVFVVNLARGTGNRRDPIRLDTAATDESETITVGDFLSATDEDAMAREREETKRLMYVALTRARDRLYLGSVLTDGTIEPGRGSLAEVLPPALLALFTARDSDRCEWRAGSGAAHRFRVCSSVVEAPVPVPVIEEVLDVASASRRDDFGPIADSSTAARLVVSGGFDAGVLPVTPPVPDDRLSSAERRLIGTLVHRLLNRCGFDQEDDGRLREAIAGARDLSDVTETVVEGAIAGYRSMCVHPDVRALYAMKRWQEVPFTMEYEGAIVRGRIDCLVRDGDNRFTVLEFKTGRPRDEHAAQLDVYRAAAAQLFPDAVVEARLVYAEEQTSA